MTVPRRIGLLMHHASAYGRQVFTGIRRCMLGRPEWNPIVSGPRPDAVLAWATEPPDGVIAHVHESQLVQPLVDLGVPVVNVSAAIPTPFDHIGLDDEAIGRLAAEHLFSRGHTRCRYIGHMDVGYVQRRRAGFHAALAAVGRKGDSLLWHPTLGEHHVVEWIRQQPYPQGILVSGDSFALRVVQICKRHGILVPEEVAVIAGTNDEEICTFADPFLTAVDLPGRAIGKRAVERLDELLQRPDQPPVKEQLAPGRVIERASTDIDAVNDPQLARVLAAIRQRAASAIAVDELAEEVGLNRRTLERQFRSAIGRSIYQHVLRTRLARAKDLLASTDLPLRVIAAQTGFATAQHFADCFRRKEGTTPGQFRLRQDKQALLTEIICDD